MTLSCWIRDYLFVPVTVRFRDSPAALYVSLLAVMALVGLCYRSGLGIRHLWRNARRVSGALPHVGEDLGVSSHKSRLACVGLAHLHSRCGYRGVGAFPRRHRSERHDMLAYMFGRFRFGYSYPVDLYLVVLLMALFCVVEPWLATLWGRVESIITGLAAGAFAILICGLAIYACGLLLFLIFDDRSMQFIYFQF